MYKFHITGLISSDIAHRMASGFFWSFAGTGLAKLLSLIGGILCAHILTQESYGEFGMVRSTINMFIVLGAGGIGVTATKYISQYKNKNKERIPIIYHTVHQFGILTGIICTLLVFVFATPICEYLLNSADLHSALRMGSILLFFSIINGVQQGALQGFERFQDIAKSTLAGSIAELIFMLVGAYFLGVNGAILGFGVGFLAIYAVNKFAIRKQFTLYGIKFISLLTTAHAPKIITNYTLPATLSALLITPVFWGVRSLLVQYSNFEELAIFEAADQWKIVILFIPTAVSQIALPILSSLGDKQASYMKTLLLNCTIVFFVASVLALLITVGSEIIMGWYGKDFANTAPLKILTLSTIFSSVANVLELAIYSIGKMWECFYINIVWAVCTIGGAILFLSKGLGALGISYAICISYIISCAIFAVFLYLLYKKGKIG